MNEVGEILMRGPSAEESGSQLKSSTPQNEAIPSKIEGFKTFQVVFRPAVLAMLCVMLYLREGWVVGNAGILGAALLILLTFFITGSAALVLSSVSTNARVGGGGILSIIGRSLGFESGGSIGIPLYFGHVFSIALYVYAFSEAWQYIFPNHPQMVVAYVAFGAVLAAAFLSQKIVFRLQDVALLLVVISFGSILLGLTSAGGYVVLLEPQLWGSFDTGGFWVLFAVFFAAGTGIKLGFNDSGALAEPRRSIPRGIFAAAGVALAAYFLMAVWYSRVASPTELLSNYLVVVDRAAWGPIVLAAILASTFTAAVITLVAAPQMLQSLGEQGVLPGRNIFGGSTANGGSRAPLAATTLLVLMTLLLGSLDRVAVLVTLFFLLSYLMIHLVIVFEQSLGLFSFRPMLRLPRVVPYLGAAACFIAIFILSPFFALVAFLSVVMIFAQLSRRPAPAPHKMARSGIPAALVDRLTGQIIRTSEEENERSWRPKVILPVKARGHLDGTYRFLRLLTEPNGSVHILGVERPSSTSGGSRAAVLGLADRDLFGPKTQREAPEDAGSGPGDAVGNSEPAADLESLSAATDVIRSETLYAQATVIEAPSLAKGFETAASLLRNSVARPNLLLGLAHLYNQDTLQGLVDVAEEHKMGIALLFLHQEAALGHERIINVWVNDFNPDWELGLRLQNLDLLLLLAIQISRNMGARLRLSIVCDEAEQASIARDFLDGLIRDARLPVETEAIVAPGTLLDEVGRAPQADLHLLSLARDVHHAFLTTLVRRTGSSFLFVRDSGQESALA